MRSVPPLIKPLILFLHGWSGPEPSWGCKWDCRRVGNYGNSAAVIAKSRASRGGRLSRYGLV
jgi:hypothetical protein